MLRLDSFDGSIATGALLGSFDIPGAGATGSAPVNGELKFQFPFRVE